MAVGRHSCIRPTFRKPLRLSITQFRPVLRTTLCIVCAGRRMANIVGTMLAVSRCAIGRDGSFSGMACLSISMNASAPSKHCGRAKAKFRDYAETASDWFWEIGPDYKFTLLTENAFGSDPADSNRHGVLGSRSRP